MPNRREFLQRVAASGVLAWSTQTPAQETGSQDVASLRILILGGTGAIGPYHVQAAVARGHRVSVFSRGKTKAELPESVERLIGDRDGNLDAIRNRDWDAVLDIATFGPGWIRSLAEALGDRVKHYAFISTVSVYENPSASKLTPEDSPVLAYKGKADPYATVTHVGDDYGALKALCEREAEKHFPGRTLVLRPGYIGGPGDNRALTYWAVRAAKGGEMLAGGDPETPVQYIDVRDLAEWAIRLAEKRAAGIYNAVGPVVPVTLGQIVETARNTFAPGAKMTWVPASWLNRRKDPEMWGTLLFWAQGVGDIMRMSNGRAVASGLKTRPVSTTLKDTLEWYRTQPAERQTALVTGFKRKPDGSGWTASEARWPDYLAHERQALADWRASAA